MLSKIIAKFSITAIFATLALTVAAGIIKTIGNLTGDDAGLPPIPERFAP